MYDAITAPHRDQRACQSKGSPAHAEHKGPVAATLDLLSVCLEVYLAEIDGPTHPPQFVRASLDVLDHCIGTFTPTDAATVGRLTTTLLDAGDAHERASRCIWQWCDEACAFLQGFLDLRGSDKPHDGQVLVSAIFTEGRTILMDAVGSLADTISLLEAARQDLDWLLSRPEASLGVLQVACAQPNDAEDFEVVDVENGDLNEVPMSFQDHLRCLATRMEDVIRLLKSGMTTLKGMNVKNELGRQIQNPASWEQMDERYLSSMEASMRRLLATCNMCRNGPLAATTHSVQVVNDYFEY